MSDSGIGVVTTAESPHHFSSEKAHNVHKQNQNPRKLSEPLRLTKGIVLLFVGLAIYVLLSGLFTSGRTITLPCWASSSSSCLSRSFMEYNMTSTSFGIIKRQTLKGNDVGFRSDATSQSPGSLIENPELPPDSPTDLRHIVFCIASTEKKWKTRKEYIKLWWQPLANGIMRRGFVWLDKPPSPSAENSTENIILPKIKISSSTDKPFPYSFRGGNPSAIRVSRIVSETLRLGLKDVRWFVLGDDDTIFFPENLATLLRRYDHSRLYYIGQSTESQMQAVAHSFGMAYGGGGIAISYALAEEMEKMQDDCLWRYPNIYGSDGRIEACAAELGVPLTREPGFHQLDVHGNIFGLLAAHPLAPFISLHHIEDIQPIFPDRNRLQAVQHLLDGGSTDPGGLLQQSICYDSSRNLTFSVSWGFAVQIFSGKLTPLELQRPSLTFRDWRSSRPHSELFTFGVRPLPKDSCELPCVYFMQSIRKTNDPEISFGTYRRQTGLKPDRCPQLIKQDIVEVYKQRHSDSWFVAPRRQCCEVVAQKFSFIRRPTLTLYVRDCKQNEIIAPRT